jgi:hypothetical protein
MPHRPPIPSRIKALKQHFSDPAVAADLIRRANPPEYASLVQWDQLRLVPGTFLDSDRHHLDADLLFLAPLSENEALFYLFFDLEVSDGTGVPERVQRGMNRISAHWRNTHGASRPQPVVLPILIPVFEG